MHYFEYQNTILIFGLWLYILYINAGHGFEYKKRLSIFENRKTKVELTSQIE